MTMLKDFLDRKAFERVKKTMTLKNPGPLEIWIRDLLGIDVGTVSKPYQQSIWVYAAINVWRRPSHIPLLLRNKKTKEPIESGSTSFLLNQPNAEMSMQEFLDWTFLWLGNNGEFFWLKEDGMKMSGQPRFYTIVPPMSMMLKNEDIDKSTGRIKQWTLNLGQGRSRKIPVDGVIHGKLPNPFNPKRGQAPLMAANLTIAADFAARTHNRWMQDRHGNIAGIMSFDGDVDPDELKLQSKLFHETYGGKENTGKIPFLGNKAKFQASSHTMKDMDWLQGQKISREEIATAFGIPPNNIGILDKATYSNFEQSSKSLWEDTLIPLGDMVASVMQRKVVSPFTKDAEIVFMYQQNVSALQADEKDKVERYTELVTKGKITPTAAAAQTGIELGEPNEAHNEVWITMSDIPAGAEREPQVDDNTKALIDAQQANNDLIKQVLETLTTRTAVEPSVRSESEAKQIELSEELRQAHGRSILNQGASAEQKLSRALKRFFFEQRSEVLKNVSKIELKTLREVVRDIHKSMDGEKDFDMHEAFQKQLADTAQEIVNQLMGGRNWDQELVELALPILQPLGETAAKRLLKEIGRTPSSFKQGTLDSFFKSQIVILQKVNETTREALLAVSQDLIDGLQTDASIDTLIDTTRTSMKGIYNNTEARRRTIARTETLRTINGARHEEIVVSGVPLKDWLSVRDGDVRDSHVELDREDPIPVDATWNINGAELRYPLDPLGPPAETINCRCTVLAKFNAGDN